MSINIFRTSQTDNIRMIYRDNSLGLLQAVGDIETFDAAARLLLVDGVGNTSLAIQIQTNGDGYTEEIEVDYYTVPTGDACEIHIG